MIFISDECSEIVGKTSKNCFLFIAYFHLCISTYIVDMKGGIDGRKDSAS